jgi:hypothetical protein
VIVRVGYGKLGRSIALPVSGWGETGGDNEPPILLNKLARMYPGIEFVIIGRNSGEDPCTLGFPANVTNAWNEDRFAAVRSIRPKYKDLPTRERMMAVSRDLVAVTADMFTGLDNIIMWLGQHGSTNFPIPVIGKPDEVTQPQESFVNYAGFITQGINKWRDQDPLTHREIWLCADNRNYLKGRDLKWPIDPVLAQYDWTKREKQFRYDDEMRCSDWNMYVDSRASLAEPNVWSCEHKYVYSGLEVSGIPSTTICSYDWDGRDHFGIIINEARAYVTVNRLDAMRNWVMQLNPTWIYGTWLEESQRALGINITPLPWSQIWNKIQTVRSTFTTPSSGSGWATTKPWEAFACGTVCFFHPKYDDQGHIIPTAAQIKRGEVDHDPELKQLALWLRTESPEQLKKRVDAVNQDRDAWLWLVQAQRRHYEKMMEENKCLSMIGTRMRLTTS